MSGGRPRLLYFAYHFPPAPAIGSVRSWNTAARLAARGWRVTVVTPEPRVWLRPEQPEQAGALAAAAGIERLLTGHAWPMLEPGYVRWLPGPAGWALGGVCRVAARRLGIDPAAGWAASARRACAALSPGDVDLVLATAGPYAAFGLAEGVARRLRCPFVLDYRDPWTGNPHAGDARRAVPSPREARLLRACAAATVVSPSWAKLIGETFGVPEKLRVVPNGFEPESFREVEGRRFGHFAVVYAGTLYPPKRVLDPVLAAFGVFLRQDPGSDARFHYYGDHGEPVARAAGRLGLSSRVVVHGSVPRAEALSAQKGAGLLVVVSSVSREGTLAERGVVTGKIFDCMALGRPALVVAPEGSDLREVARAAGAMRCFSGEQVEDMSRFIAAAAGGRVPPARDRRAFQWDAVGAGLDEVLRAALADTKR